MLEVVVRSAEVVVRSAEVVVRSAVRVVVPVRRLARQAGIQGTAGKTSNVESSSWSLGWWVPEH